MVLKSVLQMLALQQQHN